MNRFIVLRDTNLYLSHHGILNQKWGVRNGPPYPLGGGSYSKSEKTAIYRERKKKNSIYNKKHFDTVLEKDKVLTTLSYDKDRTKDVDMFYAAYTKLDKDQYNALFNKKVNSIQYDEDGQKISETQTYKFKINNKIKNNIKVASEDSGAKIFLDLWSKDRDFYNFVTDETRMESLFVTSKYKFKGYREAKKTLDKLKNKDYRPTEEDIRTIYRMFNYVIPSDASGNKRYSDDVMKQRNKFFEALKKEGYGAVLDTNDSIYGGFKAQSPVIVFDMEQIIPDSIKNTTVTDKRLSELSFVVRKALGV